MLHYATYYTIFTQRITPPMSGLDCIQLQITTVIRLLFKYERLLNSIVFQMNQDLFCLTNGKLQTAAGWHNSR